MVLTLQQIRARHVAACRAVGMQNVFHDQPRHDGSYHVEIVGDEYHFIQTERGAEYDRRVTTSPDDLLYWLAVIASSEKASSYEVDHRAEGTAGWRMRRDKQLELLRGIDSSWALRWLRESNAGSGGDVITANPSLERP
jgi:hypothetical protein